MKISTLVLLSGLFASSQALAGIAKVSSAEASSYYSEEGNYKAPRVMDGKQGTSWVEGEDGSGLGSWVQLTLEGEQTLSGIRVWGGDWYSEEYWSRANRPKDLELTFSDGSTEKITLTDEFKSQVFTFSKPVKTTSVKIKIKSVHSGSTWFDTGISEVQLITSTTSPLDTFTATSSSVAPADGDGTYEAVNVGDVIGDSLWCEGSEGDGTGEWIQLDYGKSVDVSSMTLINGMASTFPLWMKGNRATGATLTFSDGSTHDVTIANSIKPQTIAFPGKTTSSVKVTFTGVAKGKEYNDLCLAELRFD